MVSPYRITNKIVINNDGTVSQESTVLGHRTDTSNHPLQPPRKQVKNIQQPKAGNVEQQKITHRKLKRSTSNKLLPPKNIKRINPPVKPAPAHPKDDDDDDADSYDEIYQDSWVAEGYVHMNPIVSKFKASHNNSKGTKNVKVNIVNQVSVASRNTSRSALEDSGDELDPIDRDYINIQNILIELDVQSIKSSSAAKPPIKK